MTWYIVVARLAFDDEDSLAILQAASADAASDEVKRQMREDEDDDPEDEPRDFYLNYVVECATEPVLKYGQGWRQ